MRFVRLILTTASSADSCDLLVDATRAERAAHLLTGRHSATRSLAPGGVCAPATRVAGTPPCQLRSNLP